MQGMAAATPSGAPGFAGNLVADRPAASAEEAHRLARDRIPVTFFRDDAAFDSLRNAVRRRWQDRSPGEAYRVWVPGTASGEEAYSLAILLHELRGETEHPPEVLIFATDIDDGAIQTARAGTYPETALRKLPEHIRHRYFDAVNDRYSVKELLRQCTVFATQNPMGNPPFSRLDLVSCRNLLNDFSAEVQRRVMETFHDAMRAEALLLLGQSDSTEPLRDLFGEVDRAARLFHRLEGPSRPLAARRRSGADAAAAENPKAPSPRDLPAEANAQFGAVYEQLVAAYCPPAVVIDDEDNIVHFIGDLNPFLGLPRGRAQLRIYDMVPEALRIELRALIPRCRRERRVLEGSIAELNHAGQPLRVRPTVRPVTSADGAPVVVSFERITPATGSAGSNHSSERDDDIVAGLQRELTSTRQHLQSLVEDLETANEELRTQAGELHSANAELIALNDLVKARSQELTALGADLLNIRNSLDFPLMVINGKLQVTVFNERARSLIEGEAPGDLPPFAGLDWKIDVVQALPSIRDVLRTGRRTSAVVAGNGGEFELRCAPYLSPGGGIGGAVLAFIEVTRGHNDERSREEENRRLRLINAVTTEISSHADPEQVTNVAFDGIRAAYPTARFSLLELDGQGVLHSSDMGPGGTENHQRSAALTQDDLERLRVAIIRQRLSVENDRVSKRILVPVREGRTALGAMVLERNDAPWTATDVEALSALADLLSVAHGNLRALAAERMAFTVLDRERERLLATLQAIGEGVLIVDDAGNVFDLNAEAERLLGVERGKAVACPARNLLEKLSAETARALTESLARALERGGPLRQKLAAETLRRGPEGQRIVAETTIVALRAPDGSAGGAVLVVRDVTGNQLLTEELAFRASHDALTSLYNRDEFERELKNAFQDAKRHNEVHQLCYIDLDHFKVINDTCGHSAGDELLKQIATALRLKIRQADTLARLGGDEFGAILRGCSGERGLAIAQSMLEAIRSLKFNWNQDTYSIGASIGVVAVDITAESVADLLARVDAACYMAKEEGRNNVYLSQGRDDRLRERFGEMHIVNRIREAIESDRLVLYAEPVMQIAEPKAVRYHEALIRMLDSDGKAHLPGAFLPAAERYYLMDQIDRWVVEHALRGLARKISSGQNARIGINLSGQTVSDTRFIDFIERKVADFGLAAENVYFELTETTAITHLSEASELMNRLVSRGFTFVLDDFGTGMSSFAYLRRMPVQILKIDGAFMRTNAHEGVDRPLIEAMTRVARELGILTVAEHVEREAQLHILGELGVDFAQGHFWGRGVPWET